MIDAASPERLPYPFARRNGVMILEENGQCSLIQRAGANASALIEAQRVSLSPISTLRKVSEAEFDELLARQYQDGGVASDIIDDLGEEFSLDDLAEALAEPEDLMASKDDAPVIRLINAMLTEAIRNQASDVHIEPFERSLKIRYRVDGVMRDLLTPPRALAPLITSRIKIMSKLDIAEKRVPQDGRISLRVAGRPVDVRVSTLPCGHGERVVMRLLDKQAGRLDLQQLGMADSALQDLERILRIPHGIVLVTGPTGSGKTTSLYAALTRLNNQRNTILTIEDPIEYYLEGIGQTQANAKVDLDFARGLRAILRQDPDIVMVGEIRDLETAEIAIQASLTGHLVLSTLHTNTAVGAVTRLRDMGVEPFLLSSSLIGVVAQRLVRRLCTHCRTARSPDARERQWLGDIPADTQIYQANGCEQCNYSGYNGRSGIYEVIPVNDDLRILIHDGSSEQALENAARQNTLSIADDGRRLVLEGKSSVEEVLRIIRDNH